MAKFTSDIRHVSGAANVVVDVLSRSLPAADSDDAVAAAPGIWSLAQELDLEQMAKDQLQLYKEEMDSYLSGVSLKLKSFPLPSGTPLLCDVSTPRPRPVVPQAWADRVFAHAHGICHPGSRATLKSVSARFVWRNMSSQIRSLCRACTACHQSKIVRHVRAPLEHLPVPDDRFSVLHVDLVGPLPVSEGYSYLFTVIDRYTRWVEAIPLVTMTAEDCAKALIRNWMSRFGIPAQVVSDRGRQFVSHLWQELHRLLGIREVHTTSYHPQANGMIERVHRTIKVREPIGWIISL